MTNNEIKTLCELDGISGREDNVREYILSKLPKDAKASVDNLGNLLVFKPGKSRPKKTVMLCAHMDEVGFIITYITDDGYLKFSAVGGIDSAVLIGRTVKLESGVVGVIALKHIHLCSSSEASKLSGISDLVIDIGAKSKQEAEAHASLGDYAVFRSDFVAFGDDKIKGKALDDRAGCAIMLSLINSKLEYDTHFAFTVQEEVGARGALTATYAINPDIAIIIETTTAGDICGVEGDKQACKLGLGPVVSYMDRGTVYDYDLYKKAFAVAKVKQIKCQTKTLVAGGNDSSSVQRTGNGVRTMAVSLPCRYLHSPSCVLDTYDVLAAEQLITALLKGAIYD